MDLVLRDIYYNPREGFSSKEQLYLKAIKRDPSITRKYVDIWMKKQRVGQQQKRNVKILYHKIIGDGHGMGIKLM